LRFNLDAASYYDMEQEYLNMIPPSFPQNRPLRRGFTLIEILIVIAIIILLALILFPVFGRARESARRASCQSNMRQLALAVRMYTEDYSHKLAARASNTAWQTPYLNYINNTNLLKCPSATRRGSTRTSDYMSNYYVMSNKSSGWVIGTHLRWFNNAATAMLFDSDATSDGRNTASASTAGTVSTPRPPYANPSTPADYRISLRHFNGSNVAFFDGHVKWLNADTLFVKASGILINPTGAYNPIGNTTIPSTLSPSIWFTLPD
jgi:prepilin-type N-terminal cleavage/methylation domain-containing protein/prepilin-type processing-associated H-X9-DG protein